MRYLLQNAVQVKQSELHILPLIKFWMFTETGRKVVANLKEEHRNSEKLQWFSHSRPFGNTCWWWLKPNYWLNATWYQLRKACSSWKFTCSSTKMSFGCTGSSFPTSPSEGWTRTTRAEGLTYITFLLLKTLAFLEDRKINRMSAMKLKYHCSHFLHNIHPGQPAKKIHLCLCYMGVTLCQKFLLFLKCLFSHNF